MFLHNYLVPLFTNQSNQLPQPLKKPYRHTVREKCQLLYQNVLQGCKQTYYLNIFFKMKFQWKCIWSTTQNYDSFYMVKIRKSLTKRLARGTMSYNLITDILSEEALMLLEWLSSLQKFQIMREIFKTIWSPNRAKVTSKKLRSNKLITLSQKNRQSFAGAKSGCVWKLIVEEFHAGSSLNFFSKAQRFHNQRFNPGNLNVKIIIQTISQRRLNMNQDGATISL